MEEDKKVAPIMMVVRQGEGLKAMYAPDNNEKVNGHSVLEAVLFDMMQKNDEFADVVQKAVASYTLANMQKKDEKPKPEFSLDEAIALSKKMMS